MADEKIPLADNESDSSLDNKKQPPFREYTHILNFVNKVYTELGAGLYHSKEDIAKVNNLAVNSIKSILSTAVQYRLLELKFGTGYKPTDLFVKIQLPANDFEKKSAIVESLKSQDLYGEILSEYNGKVFPTVQGLTNILQRKYSLKDSVAQRTADMLFTDLRAYGLLSGSNVLSLSVSRNDQSSQHQPNGGAQNGKEDVKPKQNGNEDEEEEGLIRIVVPLKSGVDGKKRTAIIRLPEAYTDKDIQRIARIVKAYSLEGEDEDV